MAAKAVVRDVGRVLGHALRLRRPHRQADSRSSSASRSTTRWRVGEAQDRERRSRDFEALRSEEEVRELVDLARKLEGLTRNAGKHAGGVVIAPTRADRLRAAVLRSARRRRWSRSSTRTTSKRSAWSSSTSSGLRTLTIIDWAVKAINALPRAPRARRRSRSPRIPLDDRPTYRAARRARDHRGVPARIARHEGAAARSSSPTASRTSSRWWRCTAPARCNRAWSTTSSTASTGDAGGRTIRIRCWSRSSSPPTA